MERVTNICLDSCSLINLINCDRLSDVLSIPHNTFYITPSVYDEISKINDQKLIIDNLIKGNTLKLYSNNLNINLLQELFKKYNLGDGETESLLMCKKESYKLCCDDRRARKMAEAEIGKHKVMGSLRLLKKCVNNGIILCKDAFASYIEMIYHGGFLPKNIDDHFFCKDS